MNKTQLTLLNLGESLDNLANLDPRGYGVCKELYKASRVLIGKPLCLNMAEKITANLKAYDTVFILTGFVLHPYAKAETDGAIGSVLLANAFRKGMNVNSVIVCPKEAESGLVALNEKLSADAEIVVFTKDFSEASTESDPMIDKYNPKAVFAVECPGADSNGRYHNARGVDVTDLQAKTDVLFDKLKSVGVLDFAIGDLGNEIGMSAIADCLEKRIPVIPAESVTDNILTSTVSDWGCYSVVAMLSFMLGKPELMHDGLLQKEIMNVACNNGLIDMNGGHIPAIDGIGEEITSTIVQLMKELVLSTVNHSDKCDYWFEKMTEENHYA